MYVPTSLKLLGVVLVLATAGTASAQCQWYALQSGVDHEVWAFAVFQGDLYVGGKFREVDGLAANYIAKWDGSKWSPILDARQANGTNSPVYALAVGPNADGVDVLYVGGAFTYAGSVQASRIAAWDGTGWEPLGSGVIYENPPPYPSVTALSVFNNILYVGGLFTHAGGQPRRHIAAWDGTNWLSVGNGLNNQVWALTVYGDELYVGGMFWASGSLTLNGIARWDGANFSAVDGGVAGSWPYVLALNSYDGDLVVGGMFEEAGGQPAARLATWNSQSGWAELGGGVNNWVYALTTWNSSLVVGGRFTNVGCCIAQWDGANWSDLEGGLNGITCAVAVYGSDLIAGGMFTEDMNGIPLRHVARWTCP